MTTFPLALPKTTTLMARIGFGARGVMYLLIGSFAAIAALRSDQPVHGYTGALQAVAKRPLGGVAVLAIGLGLACLAGWLAIRALQRCLSGSGGKRWLLAAGLLGDAILYASFLAGIAAVVLGWHVDEERQLHGWVGLLVAHPVGRWLVGVGGAGLAAGGIGLIAWAWTQDVQGPLALPPREKRLTEPVSRYGLTGRGAALALMGGYALAAAIDANPSEAHGLGGALQHLRHTAYGWAVLLLFALAFGASAFFDFLEALYRRSDAP